MTEDEIILHVSKTQPTPSLDDVIDLITDLDADYSNLIADLTNRKVIKKAAEFTRRIGALKRRRAIQNDLGTVPHNTRELVEAVLTSCDFRIDPSSPTPLTWKCPIRGQDHLFDLHNLMQIAMDKNRNLLSSQFKDAEIKAECALFQTRTDEAVRAEIATKIAASTAVFDWHGMVGTCFDTSEVRDELVIASLKKLIWQVKRRIIGMPVTHHLMVVIYGSQGCGKTVFVTRMLEVLGSLWATTDFGRLTDNREAGLFDQYVLFLDEMHKADRAEMDAVKAVITREKYSFRPMGTNTSVSRPQNSTFIGCSNKLLGQLINDPTGNRRFFQLDFNSNSGEAEWAYVNSIDFTAMWNSVDHMAEDPTKAFFVEMAELRKQAQNDTSVGLFAKHLAENDGDYNSKEYGALTTRSIGDDVVSKDDIYLAYRNHCEAMRIGKPMEQQAFLTELRRLHRQHPDMCLQPKKTSRFNGWQYVGPLSKKGDGFGQFRQKVLQKPDTIGLDR